MTQAQHTRRQYKGGSRRNGGCPYFSPGWLENDSEDELPDFAWAIDWNKNSQVTNNGIYGGHLRRVIAYIDPPGEEAPEDSRVYTAGSTAGFGGIYVVGGSLSTAHVQSYINQLTYDDLDGFTGNAINDPSIDQLRIVLRAVAAHEADGTQYFLAPGSCTYVGHAEHNRYPLRQWVPDKDECEEDPSAGAYVVPGGYGIMQLTDDDYKNRRTVWNWQENIKKGATTAITKYRSAYNLLHQHPEVDFSTYPVNVEIEEALRLQTYALYNGNNYYWWNVQGSVVACTALTNNTTANLESHTPLATTLNLEIDTTLSGLTAIALQNGANPAQNVVVWQAAMPTATPFIWNNTGLQLLESQGNDFVSGDNQDTIDINLSLTHNGTSVQHRIHEGAASPNNVVNTGGFRPPTGWVKMGYIPVNTNTNGYRDYNNDGVRDQSGNVYSIPNWGDTTGAPNVRAGRGARYADIVRGLE